MTTVVICDDDAAVRVTLQRNLQAATEIEVLDIVASAEECLDSVKSRAPDVMLLDHHLTGMSGTDLVRILRGEGISTPVVLFSGDEDVRSLSAGLDHVEFVFTGVANAKDIVAAVRRLAAGGVHG